MRRALVLVGLFIAVIGVAYVLMHDAEQEAAASSTAPRQAAPRDAPTAHLSDKPFAQPLVIPQPPGSGGTHVVRQADGRFVQETLPTGQEPQPEAATSPFENNDSEEIRYGFALIYGPDAGVDGWRNAAEMFERCVKQVPNNALCYRGLLAAQGALQYGDAGPAPWEDQRHAFGQREPGTSAPAPTALPRAVNRAPSTLGPALPRPK